MASDQEKKILRTCTCHVVATGVRSCLFARFERAVVVHVVMHVPSVSLGADRRAARTRPVAPPVAPPKRPGSRLVQGFRARCGRRCCCRAGRALRGQGGMRWKGHGEGTAAMRGVPCDTVVYIPLSGLDIGALVALRPALACLSSCSCKASVVCAQAHQHA